MVSLTLSRQDIAHLDADDVSADAKSFGVAARVRLPPFAAPAPRSTYTFRPAGSVEPSEQISIRVSLQSLGPLVGAVVHASKGTCRVREKGRGSRRPVRVRARARPPGPCACACVPVQQCSHDEAPARLPHGVASKPTTPRPLAGSRRALSQASLKPGGALHTDGAGDRWTHESSCPSRRRRRRCLPQAEAPSGVPAAAAAAGGGPGVTVAAQVGCSERQLGRLGAVCPAFEKRILSCSFCSN